MKIVNKHRTHLEALNTFPSNFGPEGIGDGSFCDWIPDGEAWQFQGYDENGLPRSLNGRLMDAHSGLCSKHQKLPESRAKNNKTSLWVTMVVS